MEVDTIMKMHINKSYHHATLIVTLFFPDTCYCDTDLCNAAALPMASLLTVLAAALVKFFV